MSERLAQMEVARKHWAKALAAAKLYRALGLRIVNVVKTANGLKERKMHVISLQP